MMADPERRIGQRRHVIERRVLDVPIDHDERRKVGRRFSYMTPVERREGKPDPAGVTIMLNETQMAILDNFANSMGMSREYAIRFWVIDDLVSWRSRVMDREGIGR